MGTTAGIGYRLYGLNLLSDMPVPGRLQPIETVDVVIRRGPTVPTPMSVPEGELLLQWHYPDGRSILLSATVDGHILRCPGCCDFRIHDNGRVVEVCASPDFDPALVTLLLTGSVISCVLGLRGEFPLHASSVAVRGSAMAILGPSGRGKSTLAALCCAPGADSVADDVLRYRWDGADFRCELGTGELRLRTQAAELASLIPGSAAYLTTDSRTAVRVEGRAIDAPRLKAIVVPLFSRTEVDVTVTRLSRPESLVMLNRYPRMEGWTGAGPKRQQFLAMRSLAVHVPVYQALMPWGPPFRVDVAVQTLRAVGIGL